MVSRDMSKFGTKYTCYGCGAKFYDLNKEEAICPKCGANQENAPATKVAPPVPVRSKPAEDLDTDSSRDSDEEADIFDDDLGVDDEEIEIDDADLDLDSDGDDDLEDDSEDF